MADQQVVITKGEDGTVSIRELTEVGLAYEGDEEGCWSDWMDFDNFDAAFAAARHILSNSKGE